MLEISDLLETLIPRVLKGLLVLVESQRARQHTENVVGEIDNNDLDSGSRVEYGKDVVAFGDYLSLDALSVG